MLRQILHLAIVAFLLTSCGTSLGCQANCMAYNVASCSGTITVDYLEAIVKYLVP